MARLKRSCKAAAFSSISWRERITNSAAAEGVGRAQVGHEIGDGEIGFVADGRDDWNFRRSYDTRASPSLLNGARSSAEPPPRATMITSTFSLLIEITHAGGDFVRRRVALYLRRIDQDIYGMMAALEDVENVAKRRSLRGGDDADARREARDRLLALGCEKAFGFEFGFELFEGELQRSCAFGFDVFGGNLEFAAIFVDGDAPADDTCSPSAGRKRSSRAEERNITTLSWALPSFRVK